ncbi:Bromodomain-containing protein, partial [Myriangium duriaei CBS 260.36]
LTKTQRKIMEEKLKNTKKVKSAVAFLRPVDPVALNIPNYPLVVKHPMDISTMEQKLRNDQYASLESFVADFELMVNNCFAFNGPTHIVSVQAQNLRAYFLKQMDGVPTGDAAATVPKPVKKESPVAKPQPRRESRASISAGTPKSAGPPENMAGLKFCDHVVDELKKPRYHQMNQFFLEPVDPVALNIPHYFNVVKHPMDMQTITNKLKNNQYSSAEEFKADFDLMFDNCFRFNPPDNLVHQTGKQFQSEFEA